MDVMEAAPIIENAMEMLARASTTSEVLTLNLTNLLILLVLKALIFGFGLFSVGGTGRSVEEESRISPGEISGGMCFLMFTSGAEEKMDCIKRTACEDSALAQDYLTAAKMWYKMHKMFKGIVPFEDKYARLMFAVQEAVDHSNTGAACADKFSWK